MQTSSPETRDSLLQRLPNAEDTEAWEQFVALYGNVLYRVARRQGLQLADADNLVQEVMLAVSQSISQWLGREDRGRFRAWLKRIARNEAVDLLTRRTKRSLSGEEMADELLSKLPARDVLCSQLDLEYERAAFQWAAEQVKHSVANQTWLAFQLTHLEGLSIEAAAKTLQTRTANIYIGRSRVMARIKELVTTYEAQS